MMKPPDITRQLVDEAEVRAEAPEGVSVAVLTDDPEVAVAVARALAELLHPDITFPWQMWKGRKVTSYSNPQDSDILHVEPMHYEGDAIEVVVRL